VQMRAFLSIFFLSNAYCGSQECLKELQYADIEKYARVPVFLEAFAADQAEFETVATLCDPELQEFSSFEVRKNLVKRLMCTLEGVPAFMDLTDFMCVNCGDKRDAVCAKCTDWACVLELPCFAKLDEMVARLGRHIDSAAVRAGLLLDAVGIAAHDGPDSGHGLSRTGTAPVRSSHDHGASLRHTSSEMAARRHSGYSV
jgi:hypothetical protein